MEVEVARLRTRENRKMHEVQVSSAEAKGLPDGKDLGLHVADEFLLVADERRLLLLEGGEALAELLMLLHRSLEAVALDRRRHCGAVASRRAERGAPLGERDVIAAP